MSEENTPTAVEAVPTPTAEAPTKEMTAKEKKRARDAKYRAKKRAKAKATKKPTAKKPEAKAQSTKMDAAFIRAVNAIEKMSAKVIAAASIIKQVRAQDSVGVLDKALLTETMKLLVDALGLMKEAF